MAIFPTQDRKGQKISLFDEIYSLLNKISNEEKYVEYLNRENVTAVWYGFFTTLMVDYN